MHPLTLSHEKTRIYLTAKSGTIISTRISISGDDKAAQADAAKFDSDLKDRNIHDVRNFKTILRKGGDDSKHNYWTRLVGGWLNTMLGKPGLRF